jgi:DNA-directed RNA polymerase specialized sigma24 family protein/CheY-like chemotaxis protein
MDRVSQELVKYIPYLRRYARALTGSQQRGDQYVRVCLETLLEEPHRLKASGDMKLQLFSAFHDVWRIVDAAIPESRDDGAAPETRLRQQLAALPPLDRQVLLLVSLEGFSIAEAARILDISEDEAMDKLSEARAEIQRQTGARVLIVEDEPVIAMDIAAIVRSIGHTVVGVAATKDKAVLLAEEHRPGLVLADIQLKDGDSGIATVQEILTSIDVPVIFVTGFPERLLTGEHVEPAFLITKPFDPETLKIAIGQALSLNPPAEMESTRN